MCESLMCIALIAPFKWFWLAVWLTWPTVIVLIGIGIFCEYNERYSASSFVLGAIFSIIYFLFELNFIYLMIYIPVYLIFGVAWSLWKYKCYVSKIVDQNRNKSYEDLKLILFNLQPMSMINDILSWIMSWPFGALIKVTKSLSNMIFSKIKDLIQRIYSQSYNSAISKLNKE